MNILHYINRGKGGRWQRRSRPVEIIPSSLSRALIDVRPIDLIPTRGWPGTVLLYASTGAPVEDEMIFDTR